MSCRLWMIYIPNQDSPAIMPTPTIPLISPPKNTTSLSQPAHGLAPVKASSDKPTRKVALLASTQSTSYTQLAYCRPLTDLPHSFHHASLFLPSTIPRLSYGTTTRRKGLIVVLIPILPSFNSFLSSYSFLIFGFQSSQLALLARCPSSGSPWSVPYRRPLSLSFRL